MRTLTEYGLWVDGVSIDPYSGWYLRDEAERKLAQYREYFPDKPMWLVSRTITYSDWEKVPE